MIYTLKPTPNKWPANTIDKTKLKSNVKHSLIVTHKMPILKTEFQMIPFTRVERLSKSQFTMQLIALVHK